VPYRCPCGAEYLIVIGGATGRLLDAAREAAEALHASVIDGDEPSFVCAACGRVHVRGVTNGGSAGDVAT